MPKSTAYTAAKVQVWAGEISDRPGSVAAVLDALARAGAQLECVIARRQPEKPGTAVVFVTPIKGRKPQAAARDVGLQPAGNIFTLRIEGPYRPDAAARLARTIEEAGVNVRGVSGLKMDHTLVAYVGFDSPDDATRAASAVKATAQRARS